MPMENVATIVLDAKNRRVTDAIINRPGFYTVVVKSQPVGHQFTNGWLDSLDGRLGIVRELRWCFEAMAGEVLCNSAGHAIFNARQGKHDDLVLVVSLAVFGAPYENRTRVPALRGRCPYR